MEVPAANYTPEITAVPALRWQANLRSGASKRTRVQRHEQQRRGGLGPNNDEDWRVVATWKNLLGCVGAAVAFDSSRQISATLRPHWRLNGGLRVSNASRITRTPEFEGTQCDVSRTMSSRDCSIYCCEVHTIHEGHEWSARRRLTSPSTAIGIRTVSVNGFDVYCKHAPHIQLRVN